jgi:hypothetical protein
MYRLAGGPTLVMFGQISHVPTVEYLRRGGRIIGDAVIYGIDVEASVYPTSGLIFDGFPPFDAGTLAYSFPVL